MKTKKLVLISLLWFSWGCSSVNVEKSKRANFNNYKTYAWMDPDIKAGKNPVYYNAIATQNVENTVDYTLNQKGLKKNDTDPDIIVGYHFFVEQKTRTVANPAPYYGPYHGWGRWGWRGWAPGWWGWGGTTYHNERYRDGTVVVDIVDTKTHKLVWRGSVEKALGSPENISRNLAQQVNKILEKYPNS
ncbi:MAG: DUF4136 domain-containing protein [Siphonobacter sp.]